MRWMLLVAPLLIGLSAVARAEEVSPPGAAPDVVVRESLDPATGVVIGQHVALLVDVLFRGSMPRPPRVSLPDVAGLQALRFETQGTTMRETLVGEPYVGQRFEFALYAQQGGAFEIPPATITLLDPKGDVTGTAEGQTVRLDVSVPPGVDPSQAVVATRALSLSEEWTPNQKASVKAGDAIVRTITRVAEDVPGLAMRDLAFPAPDGVRVYADPPEISDRSNRGVVTGRRVDRVTYLFERSGRFVLPAATQPWWDLGGGTLQTANAPGATIDVAAPAPSEAPGKDARSGSNGIALATVCAALLMLLAFGPRFLLLRSADQAGAERTAFAAVRGACSGKDPTAIYRAFSSWLGLLPLNKRKAATKAAAPLDATLFKGGSLAWTIEDSRNLIGRLAHARQSKPAASGSSQLPPLNP